MVAPGVGEGSLPTNNERFLYSQNSLDVVELQQLSIDCK
jgi:hypothetical protein